MSKKNNFYQIQKKNLKKLKNKLDKKQKIN